MSVIQVECWNCGRNLRINADRLSTARCGNCQQLLVKPSQASADYRPVAREQKTGRSRPWLMTLLSAVLGIGFAVGVILFVAFKFGVVGVFVLFVLVIPILKAIGNFFGDVAKEFHKNKE